MRQHLTALMAVSLLLLACGVSRGAASDQVDRMTNKQLVKESRSVIAHGGILGTGWGQVTPYLRRICQEMIDRAFAPYGSWAVSWARHIVRRESGCNPAAVNYTYSDPGERATGLSQMIPNVHTWVDYRRVVRDLWYAVRVFVRLSRGGHNPGPWCLC